MRVPTRDLQFSCSNLNRQSGRGNPAFEGFERIVPVSGPIDDETPPLHGFASALICGKYPSRNDSGDR
jgi:hypothetical protein